MRLKRNASSICVRSPAEKNAIQPGQVGRKVPIAHTLHSPQISKDIQELSLFISQTVLHPDPETAKVRAQTLIDGFPYDLLNNFFII